MKRCRAHDGYGRPANPLDPGLAYFSLTPEQPELEEGWIMRSCMPRWTPLSDRRATRSPGSGMKPPGPGNQLHDWSEMESPAPGGMTDTVSKLKRRNLSSDSPEAMAPGQLDDAQSPQRHPGRTRPAHNKGQAATVCSPSREIQLARAGSWSRRRARQKVFCQPGCMVHSERGLEAHGRRRRLTRVEGEKKAPKDRGRSIRRTASGIRSAPSMGP